MLRLKYPRTLHVPWSEGRTPDDLACADLSHFEGKQVVVTEKLDGENTTIYSDGFCHARSLDSKHHPSRSWIKQLAASLVGQLPDGWRLCGENLFACHSIFYTDLPSYFFVYGIYDDSNVSLSWQEMNEYCQMLGLEVVPDICQGVFNESMVSLIKRLWTGGGAFPTFELKDPSSDEQLIPTEAEGYVIRTADRFAYDDFPNHVAKFVRKSHVRTDAHWMEREPIPNRLES